MGYLLVGHSMLQLVTLVNELINKQSFFKNTKLSHLLLETTQ